jgi:hypothetical protein
MSEISNASKDAFAFGLISSSSRFGHLVFEFVIYLFFEVWLLKIIPQKL